MRSPLILLLSLILLLTSCQQNKRQQLSGACFGTMYHITYLGAENEALPVSVDSLLADLNSTFSIFDTNSLISRINAGNYSVVNEDFAHVLRCASGVARATGGAFDFTVQPLVELWGFGRNKEPQQVAPEQLDSVRQFVNYKLVSLHDSVLVRVDPRTQINFNAIAKGYAVDKMAQFLLQQGYENFIVEIGGEVVCHGVNAKGEPWHVGITKPKLDNDGAEEDLQHIIATSDICMATSGNYRNFYYVDGERRSHTIDPRTGYPVQHSLLSATVVSSSCMRADAMATACMVLGAEQALDMIDRAGDAACYLIVAQADTLAVLTSTKWEY